jgi:hypothetical protein
MIVLQLRCSVAQAKRWRELARKSKLERAVWMRHVLDLGTVIEVKTRTTVTVKRRKIK